MYKYKNWILYHTDTRINNGDIQTIYFFSRWKPKKGITCILPEDYKVSVNSRTGLPHLEKIL